MSRHLSALAFFLGIAFLFACQEQEASSYDTPSELRPSSRVDMSSGVEAPLSSSGVEVGGSESDMDVSGGVAGDEGGAGAGAVGGDPSIPPPDMDPPMDARVDPADPASDRVRFVRITTTESPSWVSWSEIEIIGQHPDEVGGPRNLSFSATASASRAEANAPAANAIDGDESTSWNAGDFPTQWIEIDLRQPCEIHSIRLRVSQSPPGDTRHQVALGPSEDQLRLVHTFNGSTRAGQWLEYTHETSEDPPRDPVDYSDLPRGLAWVRSNPMFISGLAVSVPNPSPALVREYFDDFHATGVHLWANGLPNQLQAWSEVNHPDFRWISWVSNDGTSIDGGQLLGGGRPSQPGRIGYQIGDEPGLNMDGMQELMEVEVGIDAARSMDPNALMIVNFSWWADELDEMIDYYGSSMDGDIISYDLYSLRQSTYKRLEYFRAAGLRWNMPYWRYIFSYQDVGANNWPSESDLRWDAMLGLVYGYTGHTWFVYQVAAPHVVTSAFYTEQGGLNVPQTARWAIAAQLNLEMKHLGRAITQLTSVDVRYIPGEPLLGLLQPTGTQDWTVGAGEDPYITGFTAISSNPIIKQDLLVGFFVDDQGEHYAMLQNPNHAGGEYQVGRDDPATFEVLFNFSTAPSAVSRNHVLVLDHKTNQLVQETLSPIGQNQAKAVINLEAGDVWLFKYDTGAPFALGR